jgi:DegV family protein with EDD domain
MEMKRKVICTSTGCIEYAPERYRKLGIGIIRVHFFFKGKEYLEGLDLDPVSVYKQMENVKDTKNNLPHTAIPTYDEVASQFKQAIDEGYQEVIVIALSSYLGGTWNFIRLVAKDFQSKIKIYVIDARITCFPEGYLAVKAQEWVNAGMPTEQILKEIEWIKAHQEFIGIDGKLDYLIYNGRLKGGKAYLGKMMSICPVIHFSREGEIVPISNVIGQTGALKKTCQYLLKLIGNRDPKDYILYHVYTGTSPLDKLKVIEQRFGIKTNHEDVIMSPVSGCHNGPWLAGYCLDFIRRPDEPLE